jgi:hypothetical protein
MHKIKTITAEMSENSLSKELHFVRRNCANCLNGILQVNLFLAWKLHDRTGWATKEMPLPGLSVDVCTQASNVCIWHTGEFLFSKNPQLPVHY